MTEQKRTAYFDVLRFAATFGVILVHLCVTPWETLDIQSMEWKWFHLLDSAARWCVPMFVMISGALFLSPAKEVSFRTLCRKNLLRIGTAFVFWSMLYALLDVAKGMSVKEFPLTFLKGEYHMWFLFLIAGLYLFVPLLRKLTVSKKRTEYFLLFGGVFFFLIPRTVHLLSLFGVSFPLQGFLLSAMNVNVVSFCYLFVFVLGHYLHQYDLPKALRVVLYGLGAFGFLATVFLTLWHTQKLGFPSGSFYTYMSLNVMAMAVAMFVFAKQHLNQPRPRAAAFSRYSFGIYLSHVLFIDLLSYGALPSWAAVPCAAGVLILSYWLTKLLCRIPGLNRYIV